MIIYGSRGKTIQGTQLDGVACPSCGQASHATFGILRYAHIFWIPMFPFARIAGMECLHCKQTQLDKELPQELRTRIKQSIFSWKNVAPRFVGLFLFACFMAWVGVQTAEQHKRELAYIEQPQANDIYVVNLENILNNIEDEYKYGLIRIQNISDDTVEFQVSSNVYNKSTGPGRDIRNNKALSDDYYLDKTILISKLQIKSLKESGDIRSIKRF